MNFLPCVAKNTAAPADDQWNIHHVGVLRKFICKGRGHFKLMTTKQVLTLECAVLDTHWAVGKNIGAVDNSTFIICITLVSREPLKHFNLVDHSVHQVLVLAIRCIIWVKLNSAIEGLLGLAHITQG